MIKQSAKMVLRKTEQIFIPQKKAHGSLNILLPRNTKSDFKRF